MAEINTISICDLMSIFPQKNDELSRADYGAGLFKGPKFIRNL